MFTTFHVGHYMPLTWVSWSIDHMLWGDDLRGYKLGNIVLHGLNALLVLLLADRLLALAMPTAAARNRGVAAVVVALLFALHPLRVESVAWATERKDCLSGFFYLATILLYVRAATRPAGRRVVFALALGTYALALLAKVMSVSLPLVLVALDFYPLRRVGWAGRDAGRGSLRAVLIEKLLFILLAVPAVIVAPFAAEHAQALGSLHKYGLIDRLAISCFSLAFYVWKMLVPVRLSALYEMPPVVNEFEPQYVVAVVVVVVVVVGAVVAALRQPRRFPAALVACWCYGACLGPVMGLVQVGPQIAADRYTYLSCIGWAMLVGGGILAVVQRGRRAAVVVVGVAGVASMLALAAMTLRQCGFWADHRTLWAHAIDVDDDCAICHYNLGTALSDAGELPEAIPHFEDALRADPSFAKAAYNWGVVLADLGRAEDAVAKYRRAIEADSNYAAPHFNLAAMARERGEYDAAIKYYSRVIELTRKDIHAGERADALNALGSVLLRVGRYGDAGMRFEEALAINPNDADSRNHYGLALARLGLREQAIAQFQRALQLAPFHADAIGNLASALAAAGRHADAEDAFRRAIALAPESAAVRTSYGNFLASQKRLDDAKREYRAAIDADPSYSQAHNNLGNLYAASGDFDSAARHYREAIVGDVAFAEAYYNLGTALTRVGRISDAVAAYRDGLTQAPLHPRLIAGLAWVLATTADESVRDADEAVALAESLTGRPDYDPARALDVLAAAYAAAGRFDDAVASTDRAIAVTVERKDDALADAFRARRALYAAGKPYRMDSAHPAEP
jgi:tetratricopeptide (TPR) repeat protein